jgi:hypothetical protein
MHNTFRLNTDHFQFYLEDRAIAHDASLLWTSPIVDGRLDVLDGFIAIGTARWGRDTAVTIERQEQPPPADDVDSWDVVAEASIRTISGKVHLTTPEGDDAQAPAIPLPSGSYRVRVYYGQLQSVADELAPHGADTYRLLIWPSEPSGPRILKGESPTTPS